MSSNNDNTTSGENALVEAVSWLYDRVVDKDFLGLECAESLAKDYTSKSQSTDDAIDSLINWQTLNAGTVGFIAGVGGLLTLPITIPANIASVTYLQLRLIAAIAHIRGYDTRSDQVKNLIIACLAGGAATDLAKDAGVIIGTKFAQQTIQSIPGATLRAINRAVGFRLVARAGASAPINLVKLVPIVGGIVSAGFDAAYIRTIGAAAKAVFAPTGGPEPETLQTTEAATAPI